MQDRMFFRETHLPLPRGDVFAFFSDPGNLERITPPWLSFRILTPAPLPRGEGALYDYALRLRGLPLRWQSRIQSWEEGRCFQDVQIRGPYAKWEHLHVFEDIPGEGTRMRDEVRWRLPFGWAGALAIPWVERDLAAIFQFREQALRTLLASEGAR